jgi:alkylation response protein AidB-like acyl-CoA dehydrogenase
MYSFEPTDEQKMLVETINRYSTSALRGAAHDADETFEIPRKLINKGWELGFLQASIPERYGGFGERLAGCGALAAEELAYGDLSGALAVMTPGLYAIPILIAGSEGQKIRLLPPVVEMDWLPYTAALIEPAFDFDPNDLHTQAVDDGADYVINGKKIYVPYAENYESMIVYARLENKTQGFLTPKGTRGVEVGARDKTLGIHALPLYQVNLIDVRIPKNNRLGGEQGHDFAPILDNMRVTLAAMAVGLARSALEYSSEYAKEREVFGVKVAQKQSIAFMIAEMATEIEAVRLLVWESAWMLDANKPEASREAYLALTAATDMAMMVTDRAVQILGGHGYIRDHPVELWMRNGRGIAMLNGIAIS